MDSDPDPRPPAAPEAARERQPRLDFQSVYRDHFAFVWRSLKRLGVAPPSLDDAAQEVFLTVHRRLGEFEGRSAVKTWLFGIVLNTARHHRRAVARRRDREPLPETLADPAHPGPDEAAQRAQAAEVLQRFLEELDDPLRCCFILSELEQMTAPEVAAATGANLHTIHSRIRTARMLFEQLVARQRVRDPWRNL